MSWAFFCTIFLWNFTFVYVGTARHLFLLFWFHFFLYFSITNVFCFSYTFLFVFPHQPGDMEISVCVFFSWKIVTSCIIYCNSKGKNSFFSFFGPTKFCVAAVFLVYSFSGEKVTNLFGILCGISKSFELSVLKFKTFFRYFSYDVLTNLLRTI